jgi:SAM-dependent methyltransferase
MKKFDKTYWDKNYSDPKSMDGIGNAKEHIKYLESFFAVEHININSILDLGFGYGYLLKEALKTFKPYKALGIEPSSHAFKKVKRDWLKPVPSTKLNLYEEDLISWCRNYQRSNRFDLGICTSVFQYISDKDLKEIIPILSQRIKYLYLTVPTDIELQRQISELEFKDEYAIHRTRKKYQMLINKHFTFVSARILESKYFFNERTTHFTDLLYRF